MKILVNGAFGRMGTLACSTIQAHKDFTLVATTGKSDNFSQTIIKTKPDIVLDLTSADCVWKNVNIILDHCVSPIIGTSGLTDEQLDHIKIKASHLKIGGLVIPNFSIGAVLQMRYAAEIAKYFAAVEIVEMHHDKKLDAPSSTAITTAKKISEKRKVTNDNARKEIEILTGARGGKQNDISIHAIRLPGIVAKQEVIFGGEAETLTIEHNTISREAFMPGIILACQKVKQFDTMHLGLDACL